MLQATAKGEMPVKARAKLVSIVICLVIAGSVVASCRNAEDQANTGDKYYKQGNYQQAIAEYNRALRLDSASPDLLLKRGFANLHAGLYIEAESDLSRAIELSPEVGKAFFGRALARSMLNQTDFAMKDMDMALNLDRSLFRNTEPDMATAYFNLGAAYKTGVKAKAFLGAAIRLNPKLYEAYLKRADMYLFDDVYDLAIQDLNKAIVLMPESAEAYDKRGFAYLEKGDLQLALNDLSRAIELDGNLATAYSHRGWAYFKLNNYRQAERDLNTAVLLDTSSPLPYLYRGYLNQAMGEPARAFADFNQALKLSSDPRITARAEQGIEALSNR